MRSKSLSLGVAVLLAVSTARASHPENPSSLVQQDQGGAAIPFGGTVNSTNVQLSASSSSLTCDSTTPSYKLELEVRPAGSTFTGTPTHSSALMAKPSCVTQAYPFTQVSLTPGQYSWRAREVTTYAGSWVWFGDGGVAFTVATGPYALLQPATALPFGNQRVGVVSQPLPIVVSNPGNQNLVITNVVTSAGFSFTGPTSTTLVPGGSVTYQVTVTPPALGAVSGTFTLTSNSGGTAGTNSVVALSANGALPQLQLPSSTVSFGDVGVNSAAASLPVTVSNTGQAPLTLSGATSTNPVFGATGVTALIVPPASSKTFSVTFAPTAQGAQNAILTLSSDDPSSPHTLTLTGNGIAPKVSLSQTSVAFADVTVGESSSSTSLTLTNTGTGALTLAAPSVSGPFLLAGLTAGSVPQGGTRQFTVTFRPTAPGPATGTLSIQSNDAASPATVTLTGMGRAPTLVAAPASHSFGSVDLGTSATVIITLSNGGDAPLDLTGLSFSGANAADFSLPSGPTPPLQLGAGQSSQLTVRFSPRDHLARAATLVILSNRYPAGPLSVALSGSGIGPKLVVTPSALSFGSVNVSGGTQTRSLSVENAGETDLVVSSVLFSGMAGADYSTPTNLPLTVAAGQSGTLDVVFDPSAAGPRAGKATVVSNDTLTSDVEVTLDGTGTSPAVQVSPPVLDFGPVRVGRTLPSSLSITNAGNGPLLVSTVEVTGSDAARFTLGQLSLPATVAPSASLSVQVTFAPTSVGVVSANVVVSSDDPNAPSAGATLVGTGTSPTMSLSPAELDFGAQLVGRPSNPRPVELRNNGTAPLTVTALTLTGEQASSYGVAPAAPLAIGPGERLSLAVTLSPTSTGSQAARLTVTSDDSAAPQAHVQLGGTGVSSFLLASPASLDFGALRIGMSSEPRSITLTNSSGETLVLTSGTLSGPRASEFVVSTQSGTIGPNASTTASVVFRPASGGSATASVAFGATDPRVPPAVVTLAGQAVSSIVELAPGTVDFGPVVLGKSAEQLVTVTNRAGQPIDLTASSSDLQFSADDSGLKALPPGASGTLEVTFTPDQLTQSSATISLKVDGQSAAEATLTVTGAGILKSAGGCGCGSSGAPLLALALAGVGVLGRRRRRAS